MMRPLMAEALNEAEKLSKRGEIPRLIIEAPTGYGKTISGPQMFKVIAEAGLSYSFIHVFPLRALVRDFYLCTLLSRCESSEAFKEVGETLNSIGIKSHDIAYQMGEYLEYLEELENVARKEPLFNARYVVTTIDSFVYNLFRIPVTEMFRSRKHYAIPRLRIFVSSVYLDEAHSAFEEPEEESPIFTSFLKALEVLRVMKVPTVLASATMPHKAFNQLESILGDIRRVRLSAKEGRNGKEIEVRDEDFVGSVTSVAWKTDMIRYGEVVEKAVERLNRGQRTFIACDTVADAINRYKALLERAHGNRIVLVHGFMTRGDRSMALTEIRSADAVIATSVVEAGVNMSLDVLITDGSRLSSVIQRAGRICRDPGLCEEAEVLVVREKSNENLLKFIENVKKKGKEVCWRLPFDINEYVGYGKLLDTVGLPEVDKELSRALEAISSPLFVSSETIDQVIKRFNYAITRTFLAEAYVGDINSLENSRYRDVVSNSLPLPFKRVDRLIRCGCISGMVVAYGDRHVEEAKIVCGTKDLASGSNSFSTKKYMECLMKIMKIKRGRDLLFAGLAVNKKCYAKRLGLRAGCLAP